MTCAPLIMVLPRLIVFPSKSTRNPLAKCVGLADSAETADFGQLLFPRDGTRLMQFHGSLERLWASIGLECFRMEPGSPLTY
jgi:hypothetical protein